LPFGQNTIELNLNKTPYFAPRAKAAKVMPGAMERLAKKQVFLKLTLAPSP
jgi:hypothetical protein